MSLDPIRVLIVEDNPGDAKLMALELEKDGFMPDWQRVETESAFLSAMASLPDVVLADLHLPLFDGLRALELLQESKADIPFLLVSGEVADEFAVEAMKRGAQDYLLKDRLARLGEAVRRALEQRRLRQENIVATKALRESEERYRLISQITSDYAYSLRVESDGRLFCEWMTESFTRVTGFTVDEINAGGWMSLHHPDDVSGVEQHHQAVLLGKAEPIEFRIITKTGEIRWIWSFARRAWEDAQPRAARILGAGKDITRRKELEQQLIQAQKMEAVGRLGAGIAHDFNNILTLIAGYTGLLLARVPPQDPLRREITGIRAACQRATALTKRLLALGRPQSQHTSVIDLNATITDLEPLLRRVLADEVHLTTDLDPGLGRVAADQVQIEQILMNLVINARDATTPGGQVVIATANVQFDETISAVHSVTPGEYILLSVTDSGEGMDSGTQARIFEPFFTTKDVGKGTGLGLWTVREIIQHARGSIRVESQPGRGTIFKILLPRSHESGDLLPLVKATSHPTNGSETLLIVEDDEDLRVLMQEILEPAGYSILLAHDGAQAIAAADNHTGELPLLVTDVAMPAMSGTDLANRLAASRPDMRVLYISGHSAETVAQEAPTLIGRAYLQKPFTGEALLRSIREVLDMPTQATILVADDDTEIRKLLHDVLSKSGYRVIQATNGQQAVEQLGKQHVDVLVTDLLMPDQEGIETIRTVKKQFPLLRIVAMSGTFGAQFFKIAGLMGADQVLRKPFDTLTIRDTIRQLLLQTHDRP